MKFAVVVLAVITVLLDTKAEAQGSNFEKAALERHNFYRKKHGAPALELDPELTRVAQGWADHLAQQDSMQHNPAVKNEYGESLYITSKRYEYKYMADLGRDAVDAWYDEHRLYDYNVDPLEAGSNYFMKVGHFTQLVWKGTTKIGVAMATSTSGKNIVVANYSPPGNVKGWFKYEVSPPTY